MLKYIIYENGLTADIIYWVHKKEYMQVIHAFILKIYIWLKYTVKVSDGGENPQSFSSVTWS